LRFSTFPRKRELTEVKQFTPSVQSATFTSTAMSLKAAQMLQNIAVSMQIIDPDYGDMYADAAFWAKNPGYVDYLAPQLYIGFDHAYAPFDKAIERWQTLPRLQTVDMIAGLALYKTGLLEDTWAGTAGKVEWKNNNDIMSRQIALTKSLDWDGVAFYSHQSFEVGSDRDATVANADMAAACKDWLVFE